MDGKSLNISEEKLNKLKEIIPEAFTENKIDWEKLKAALGEDIEFNNERYVLNWAGKSDAFRILQSPSTATLVPRREESVNFNKAENIFIEGENLEVLKVDEDIIKKVIAEKPNKVITLDRLFKNNDQLKTNTALQMKDAGIEFKAV